jgi:hypothetical protein
MRIRRLPYVLLGAVLVSLAGLTGVAADDHTNTTTAQTIEVADSRTGDGPCGFPVQRDIAGSVEVVPTIDASGNLVLTVDPVSLHGSLTNPANGKSVELKWVEQNSDAVLAANGTDATVSLALTGRIFRGYDVAPSAVALNLPADGAELVEFEPGGRSQDAWAHVCGLLA